MNKTVSFARHQAVGAYRRWEPPDFGAPPVPTAAEPKPVKPKPDPKPIVSPSPIAQAPSETTPPLAEEKAETESLSMSLPLPTVAEIERIHEEAQRSGFDEGFNEGFNEGLTEGREKGYAEGRQAGFREGHEAGFSEGKAATEKEARQLHELTLQLEQALVTLDAEIAEELMSLAIEFARKIIQHTLAVEPEAVVSAIRTVLQNLPQSRVQIHLNPDDIALARSYLGEVFGQTEHVLIEDETVSPGGCRVETPGAQIDATMETRWRRTIEALGREHAPWAPTNDRRTKARRASDKPQAKKETQAKAAT